MFGSQILEIAIGMVFVYLSLSLICSGINEWIAHLLQSRANHLEQWIRDLLSGSGSPGQDYWTDFQNHPLIKALYQSSNKPTSIPLVGTLFRSNKKPSYIPSRTFVLALLDVVVPVKSVGGSRTVENVRDTLMKLPASPIKGTLLALVDGAGNDVDKVRQNIEGWFNDAMERLSGWYKQRTRWVILGLAVAVTLALNVNTIYVFNSLYHDGTVRAAVVAAAQQATQQSTPADTQFPLTRIDQYQQELEQLNIPIGWSDPKLRSDLNDPQTIPIALFGWLITALAVSQGAPFWFDVLNKLVNVRTTGARPPTTPATEPANSQVVVQPTIQVANGRTEEVQAGK